MSRRIVAPVLLLVAAALSIAAVFVVFDIEASGGPLAQPSAVPPSFSPNGDGIQDDVRIGFTTKRRERVTVEIRTLDGKLVRRLMNREPVNGAHAARWDGTARGRRAANGTYRVVITRVGDRREYEPARRIELDTMPPRAIIDRARVDGDRLTGLALVTPRTTLAFEQPDGTGRYRVFAPPNPNAESATPGRPVPRGMEVLLFFAEPVPTRVLARDRAGNVVELDMSEFA